MGSAKMDDPETSLSGGAADARSLSRRDVVRLMAAAGIATAAGVGGRPAAAGTDPLSLLAGLRETLFDDGWRFTLGDPAGASTAGYDDSGWSGIELPHDWSLMDQPDASGDDSVTADPALFSSAVGPDRIGPFQKVRTSTLDQSAQESGIAWTRTGIGWYRKSFPVQALLPGEKIEIRFDGINQNADIYLNGVHLGFHPYGYTSFTLDLTPHLRVGGSNVLAVRVNNSGVGSRWYAGSGIYRHVWLTRRLATSVPYSGLWITTPSVSASEAVVEVEVTLESAWSRRVELALGIRDASGRFVGYAGQEQAVAAGTGPVRLRATVADPQLWSPDSPTLYRAELLVIADNLPSDFVSSTFGIRTVSIDAVNGFQLNGRTMKMKGGCVHSTNGFLGAMSIDRAEIRRVEQMKEAGFNAVRCSHNPPSPVFLDACDRLGLLVYDEAFDMWDVAKRPQDYSNFFNQYGLSDVAAMVTRDRNHPSIVLWSIGNEISDIDTATGAAIGRSLAGQVRTLDPTRPVCSGGGSTNLSGEQWSYLDLGDFHYRDDIYAPAHAAHPNTPLICSESLPFSLYDNWKAVEQNDFLVGDFVWTALDYLGESGIGWVALQEAGLPLIDPALLNQGNWSDVSESIFFRPFPWYISNCGDIDLVGTRKPQSYFRDVVWGRSPVEMFVMRPTPPGTSQQIGPWGWPDELPSWTWPDQAGQALLVNVYSSGDRVELFLNARRVGQTSLGDADKFRTQFSVPYQPGLLVAVAYRNDKVIGIKTLSTVGPAAGLRLVPDRQALDADRNDLSHVVAEVVDAAGHLVPDAVVNVSFTIQGQGEIVAAGSGNPRNMASIRQPHHDTYRGRALAIVRPFVQRGRITLAAQAPGLLPGRVSLSVG
jgi:beta-galactosidase